MKNATLPDSRMDKRIRDMLLWETGWVVPMAMFADETRKLWLWEDHLVNSSYMGSGTLILNRLYIFRAESGFVVNLLKCPEFKWEPIKHPDFGKALPVVRLIE